MTSFDDILKNIEIRNYNFLKYHKEAYLIEQIIKLKIQSPLYVREVSESLGLEFGELLSEQLNLLSLLFGLVEKLPID